MTWLLVRASAATAAVTSAAVTSEVVYADGRFFFPSRAPAAPPAAPPQTCLGPTRQTSQVRVRFLAVGLIQNSLSVAKALRRINNSPLAKQVFDFMPK
jgi:hypothetical protein